MKVHKCDRCKEYFDVGIGSPWVTGLHLDEDFIAVFLDSYTDQVVKQVRSESDDQREVIRATHDLTVDLCPKCASGLRELINNWWAR